MVESGLAFPDFENLCKGFGLNYYCSNTETNLSQEIAHSLKQGGPYLHEIVLDLDQGFTPKLSSRKLDDGSMVTSELEDMAPFLDKNEMSQLKKEEMSL